MPLVRTAAAYVGGLMGHEVQVYFAGDLAGSGTIHPEIWTHVLHAEIVVADTTDYNPNVMYELGVAAAWRPHASVILLRDTKGGVSSAFDLQPARQILYDSSKMDRIDGLVQRLAQNMLTCLAAVPFSDEPPVNTPLRFTAPLVHEKDSKYLWSPGPGHRRLTGEGLEFGSPFYFPYSWLSVPKVRPVNVRVRAHMRFAFQSSDECFIGIALRSQGYLANNEHLVSLRQNGEINRTGPGAEPHGKDEAPVGQLSPFDPSARTFIPFDVSMDDTNWSIAVQDVAAIIPLSTLPYVFSQGRVMFQTFGCRALIRDVRVEVG